MNTEKKYFIRSSTVYLGALILVFLYLLFRNYGVYPSVFADEYYYSKFSRLIPFSEAIIPNYFYFWTYSFTNACKDGFLDCTRLFNTVFFVSAAPFIYLITRKVASKNMAFFVAALSMLGPINSYTAYFMPETMYFFVFWLLSWFILNLKKDSPNRAWLIPAIIYGAMSLVKPHALFLLPAFIIYFIFLLRDSDNKLWMKRSVLIAFLFTAVFFFTKFLLGFILAGKAGLTLMGHYGTVASSLEFDFQQYIDLFFKVIENLTGHLLGLLILFSVPLIILITSIKSFFVRSISDNDFLKLSLYTLLLTLVLLAMVTVFTAGITGISPDETNDRLHMRYYNFIFPLFLIVAVSQLTTIQHLSKIVKIFLGAIFSGTIIYAMWSYLAYFRPSFIDSPELAGVACDLRVFYPACLLSLVALITWLFNNRLGSKIYLFILMPLTIIISFYFVHQNMKNRLMTADIYDKAGMFTASFYLSPEEISRLVVLGPHMDFSFRTLFYLDNPNAQAIKMPEGLVDMSKIPENTQWLLTLGHYVLPFEPINKMIQGEFSLLQIKENEYAELVDFKKSFWSNVERISGLSWGETWGRWSDGNTVTLEFVKPLPPKFIVYIDGGAFKKGEQSFSMRVGQEQHTFSLKSGFNPQEVALTFNNPNASHSIIIDIPQPASPREMGDGLDERQLGIALRHIKIKEVK